MRHYLFLDESGDHGLVNIDPAFPVFVLCGTLLSEENHKTVDDSISELKEKFWPGKKVILHSRDIRKCEKEFQILLNLEIKNQFYEGLNTIISESIYTVIASCINKEKHIKQYGRLAEDVYGIALSFVIERTVFCLDSIKEDDKTLKIIIEKRGKKEDKQLAEHFQKIQSRGTGYVSGERLQAYQMEIEFRNKSENINGLQLSDLIAYPIARFVIDPERANPSFETLKPKFYTRSGKRYGLKIFP